VAMAPRRSTSMTLPHRRSPQPISDRRTALRPPTMGARAPLPVGHSGPHVHDPDPASTEHPERRRWHDTRPDEVAVLVTFTAAMENELAANAHKGDRPGWMAATPETLFGEIMYHAAKLIYAYRQHRQGDDSIEKVREFAADVANMAMMFADRVGALGRPASSGEVKDAG
jgi:hypothetical protein